MAIGRSGADDYCDACVEEVANHETDHGILCDKCYAEIYGPPKEEEEL